MGRFVCVYISVFKNEIDNFLIDMVMPVIPVPGRQRQADLLDGVQPSLQSEFLDSRSYISETVSKLKERKKRKPLSGLLLFLTQRPAPPRLYCLWVRRGDK